MNQSLDHIKRRPLLGLCPIGKFVFSHEEAMRIKGELQNKLREWNVDFVDLEGVIPDGMVRDQNHVDPVVSHFRSKNIDGLFMPHCNFGTEGAAGMIGKKVGAPVLLWGPRDDAPLANGTRMRDTLCGLFASSKVLGKLGVPFTYIENCRLNEPPLRHGIETFTGAINVADIFRRGIRIGHIGARIDFFWTTIANESELLQRFNIEVVPIDMVTFVQNVRSRHMENRGSYARECQELKSRIAIEGFKNNEPLELILAVRDQMLAQTADLGLSALAIQDFMSLVDAMGAYCFFADSLVADVMPLSIESDIHGAISVAMMHRASQGAHPVFLTEYTNRHPTDNNGVLMWHVGAPTEYLKSGERIKLGHHWILPSPLAGMPHFPLRDGPVTVARFDGDTGDYRLAIGEAHTMAGPYTLNNYFWMKVDNWPRWECTLMEGPFIHHTAMAYGNYTAALIESCKFIPSLKPVILNER